MTTYPGIDASNWQGEITPAIAACLAENVSIAVVRASLESPRLVAIAKRQIEACQAAGLQVHGYLWMYPSWDPVKTVGDAMREYGAYGLPWFWIDAEETGDVASPARNAAWLTAALAALEEHGVRAGVYSGKWWWDEHMAGSTAFRETPLWYAEYDGDPDLYRWTPFGGWRNPAGKQYDATHGLCGIEPIDRDTFADWVYAPIPPEPPQPRPEQVLALLGEMVERDTQDLIRAQVRLDADRARLLEAIDERRG